MSTKSVSTISLTWGPPESWNGEPNGYNLSVEQLQQEFHVSDTSYVLTELTEGTEYNFVLQVMNALIIKVISVMFLPPYLILNS